MFTSLFSLSLTYTQTVSIYIYTNKENNTLILEDDGVNLRRRCPLRPGRSWMKKQVGVEMINMYNVFMRNITKEIDKYF